MVCCSPSFLEAARPFSHSRHNNSVPWSLWDQISPQWDSFAWPSLLSLPFYLSPHPVWPINTPYVTPSPCLGGLYCSVWPPLGFKISSPVCLFISKHAFKKKTIHAYTLAYIKITAMGKTKLTFFQKVYFLCNQVNLYLYLLSIQILIKLFGK